MAWFLVKRKSDGKYFSTERNMNYYDFRDIVPFSFEFKGQFPSIYVDIWRDFYNGKINRKELNEQLDLW